MKKLSFLLGIALAIFASANLAVATQTFTEDIVVPSLRVGSQGVGGVTFFNGTIINTTTDTETEADMPVTFGDNVRIDGTIYRTEEGGDNPIKVADSIRPSLDGTNSLGTSDYRFKDGYFSGTVTMAGLAGEGIVEESNLADDSVTSAKIGYLAVEAGNLAKDSVTSGKIADATITGSDIDSSADVTVNSLAVATTVDGVDVSTIPDYYVSQTSPTWDAKQGIVSVSPSACDISDSLTRYRKSNFIVFPEDAAVIYCPVQLPHGSTVTGFYANLTDSVAGSNLTVNLVRTLMWTGDSTSESLASVASSGASGKVILSDTSMQVADVDNDQYTYSLGLIFEISDDNLAFHGAKITYEFTEPY